MILNRKYQILQQQVEAYEEEVNAKKLKIADMINIIWRHGNPKLIEEIDSSMGIQWYLLYFYSNIYLYLFSK